MSESRTRTKYTYDSLLRTTSAVTKGSTSYPTWGLSWSYDRYGNRTAQSVTAGSAPSSSLVVDVTTNRPTGYTFDSSGNMTVEPVGSTNNNYAYDGEARMKTVSGGATVAYTYDGNDLRVKKVVTGGTTTVYVFASGKDIAEYDNGAAVSSPTREYIYANSELISTITASSTVYHHHDHLSVRLTTDVNGNVVGQQGHFPYGETWYSQTNTTKFIFATYEHDFETGLDYALARYYDSRMGRFCSPDPVEGWPEDPQSWNRYAYSRNDPVNMLDPTGKNWLTSLLQGILIALAEFFSGGTATPFVVAAESGGPSDQLLLAIIFGIGQGMERIGDQPMGGGKLQNATQSQAPKGYHPCPPVPFIITPMHKNQAKGKEPTGMNSQIPGSADVDPRKFGFDYPGPEDQSKEALQRRDQSMRQFRKVAGPQSPILLYPVGPTPKNMPQPPYVVRGVGDKNVRASDTPWADIRVNNDKVQFKKTIPMVVYVPKGVSCPQGPH